MADAPKEFINFDEIAVADNGDLLLICHDPFGDNVIKRITVENFLNAVVGGQAVGKYFSLMNMGG